IGELLAAGPAPEADGDAQRESLRSTLSVLDAELLHVTSVPLRSPATFFRYCRLLLGYFEHGPKTLPDSAFPALVVSSEDDAIAHVEASRSVAERLGAELHVAPSGGHFAPCKDDALVSFALDFIARCSGPKLSTTNARLAPKLPAAPRHAA
ncbi:MAG TPA: alpha/beta hydrolase, partial [Polyangiaceae bacterium]|nr:alpha/beta hydrolase [Polyangiaceae bacterium]